MRRILRAVGAERPGASLRSLFERAWPAYRRWYLRDGEAARPTWLECERALRTHMPELLPSWQHVVEAVGGGDLEARFLSQWRPRPYLTACSQAAWTQGSPLLVRNYDYHPSLWDGTLLRSNWNGRAVLAMGDCLWGALDGINDAGLAVALSFGGRRTVGVGFGMPVILRYVLEFCMNTAEAVDALERIPSHMAYNVTVLDAEGSVRTVRVSPDRAPVTTVAPYAVNHQVDGEWPEYAFATRSPERGRLLHDALERPDVDAAAFVDRFLQPPLRADAFGHGWGTLYTAIYRPGDRSLTLRWPGHERTWWLDDFREDEFELTFHGALGTLAVKTPIVPITGASRPERGRT